MSNLTDLRPPAQERTVKVADKKPQLSAATQADLDNMTDEQRTRLVAFCQAYVNAGFTAPLSRRQIFAIANGEKIQPVIEAPADPLTVDRRPRARLQLRKDKENGR